MNKINKILLAFALFVGMVFVGYEVYAEFGVNPKCNKERINCAPTQQMECDADFCMCICIDTPTN